MKVAAERASSSSQPVVGYVVGTFLGFTETFLYNQMRSLQRYQPLVLCHTRAHPERFPWAGPLVYRKTQPPRLMLSVRRLHGVAPLDPTWRAALTEHRTAVLHGQFGPNALHAAVYAKQLGLPLVTSFYGYDVGYLEAALKHLRSHWHYMLGRRTLFEATDLVLALSGAMRDDLARLGCPREKIRVHPNGVDLTRFSPVALAERAARTGPMHVVLCGRADEKKGFAYGFRALRRALDAGAAVRASWLLAPGPLEAELRALLGELGLSPHVEILDPSTDPALVMKRADLMLSPSVTAANGDKEGVPTVLVEAAGCGLPAIASRHAGIPEIVVDGESGLLTAERDVEALAAGLVRLASERDLRLRMGEAARRKAEAVYDAHKLVSRLEEYYDAARDLASRRGMD